MQQPARFTLPPKAGQPNLFTFTWVSLSHIRIPPSLLSNHYHFLALQGRNTITKMSNAQWQPVNWPVNKHEMKDGRGCKRPVEFFEIHRENMKSNSFHAHDRGVIKTLGSSLFMEILNRESLNAMSFMEVDGQFSIQTWHFPSSNWLNFAINMNVSYNGTIWNSQESICIQFSLAHHLCVSSV